MVGLSVPIPIDPAAPTLILSTLFVLTVSTLVAGEPMEAPVPTANPPPVTPPESAIGEEIVIVEIPVSD